jgi:hypothetical protein
MTARIPELYAPAAEVAPWRREARATRYRRIVERSLEILIGDRDLASAVALDESAVRIPEDAWKEPDFELLLALHHELSRWSGIDRLAIGDLLLEVGARIARESRELHFAIERKMDAEENDSLK